MPLFEVRDLSVEVEGKKILSDINFSVETGQVFVLFGPNGSGKSSLLKAIVGLSGYKISSGNVFFLGRRINDLPIDERVSLGLGMMFQHPPRIIGVKLSEIIDRIAKRDVDIAHYVKMLRLEYLMERELNVGFSGGEIKRAELLQLLVMKPKLILLDEPESGVDIENISLMGKVLREFLEESKAACFVITHTGYIIEHLPQGLGALMLDGKLYCMGDPQKLFATIKENGYEKCKECSIRYAK